MPQYKDTKAHRAEQELLRQIKLGNYPRGSRLPSTQELAQQLNVSHMTIRKIVAKLISLQQSPGRHFCQQCHSRTQTAPPVGDRFPRLRQSVFYGNHDAVECIV